MADTSGHSSFHVYRVGGLLSDDKVVKAEDKTTILYHLLGSRTATQWQFSLYPPRQNRDPVSHVISPYLGPRTISDTPGPYVVTMYPEKHPIQLERSNGGKRSFKGPDGEVYQWKLNPCLLRSAMECLDARGVVVATYRTTVLAISKDGELRIYPAGRFMAHLLVATALAIRMPAH